MTSAVSRATRAVAENPYLSAAIGAVMALLVAALSYAAHQLVDVDRRVSVMDLQIDNAAKRSEALETQAREQTRVTGEILQNLAALLEAQKWTQRSLDRIENSVGAKGK